MPYSFEGTIKDTTNGNSLVGFTIHKNFGYPNFYQPIDTITDSTYLVTFEAQMPYDSIYNEAHNKLQIRNLNNIVVDSFAIPVSIWLHFDTVTYNRNF